MLRYKKESLLKEAKHDQGYQKEIKRRDLNKTSFTTKIRHGKGVGKKTRGGKEGRYRSYMAFRRVKSKLFLTPLKNT